jgi:CheY-like chemotaxis protein
MGFNVLVAEPHNAQWDSIAKGIRQHLPDASILRVMDGEQVLRFLFDRGLPTGEPQAPDLVLLSAELPGVCVGHVLALLRYDPRMRTIPVIVLWRDRGKSTVDLPDMLKPQERLLRISGADALDAQVAQAVHRLCTQQARCRYVSKEA